MDPITQRAQLGQNGLYFVGQSAVDEAANKEVLLGNIAKFNDRLSSSKVFGNIIDFGNGSRVRVQDMVDSTVSGVFSTDVLKRYDFQLDDNTSGTNFNVSSRLQKAKIRGLLSSEGIQLSDRRLDAIESFVAMPIRKFTDPEGIMADSLVTAFHEIGHSGSSLSGLGEMLSNQRLNFKQLNAAKYPSPLDVPFDDKLNFFLTQMARTRNGRSKG